jgi:hypothetical protein
MGFEIARTIFTDRSIVHNQAVQTAALIGPDVATPATGVALNDIDPVDFQQLALYVTACTFAFTGGSTDPTLQLRVQRKINDGDDATDANWEDLVALPAITGSLSVPEATHIGMHQQQSTAPGTSDTGYTVARDSMSADADVFSPVPRRLRIREVTSGGDRTGGSATYTMALVGRSNYHYGG